ncbi:MAG: hypothetical protein LBR55_02565 [Bacteroidales bacterium]|jgi:hypothetical protein|nr:hypothetical protein [Bacteroidales bacterium]
MKTIKKYTLLIVCFCSSLSSFACLSAYQFKIFPAGFVDNEIVTVDFQIQRGGTMSENEEFLMDWYLWAYISTYNQNQQLIKAAPFDSVKIKSDEYLPKLQEMYNAAFAKIQTDFPSIELFTPTYISFCDFQTKCKLIEIHTVNDTITYSATYTEIYKIPDALLYKNKKYPLDIIKDTLYYGFKGALEYIEIPRYISSYRIYEAGTVKLVVFHLGRGDDLYMREEYKTPAKEHKPKFNFKDIKTAVYEEPLLHHGFGFDAFFVE